MNNGASSSNPPPPPPPALLAPGFRFHPTDEELVSYFLKRKVFGQPLRVDAIAEVDLYMAEPWDLPTLSRLRSRDMEWYFFSPLERKYANRSRTNRTTAQGYWKTTGKDRPIRHGPRTIGMKKTLVFHVGRAPRGERTNWVMHEYRLEDEELAHTGITQDSCVVCRIFQKSGSGPQNGAQYGAPFIEEEWEEEADNMALAVVDGGDADNLAMATVGGGDTAVIGAGDGEYLQLSDFKDNQDQGNQCGIGGLLTLNSDGQNSGSGPGDDPIFLVEGIFQDQRFTDDMNAPGLQDRPTLYDDVGGSTVLSVQFHSPSQNDRYLEMNDFVDTVNVDSTSSGDSVGCFSGECNGQMSLNQGDGKKNLPEIYGVEEFFDMANENTDSAVMFQTCPLQDNFYLEPNDLLNPTIGDHPYDQTGEDNLVFYDASSNDLLFGQDNFVQTNDLYSMAGSSGFNVVDDIMAYFDSTDNLHYSTSDSSSEKLCVGSSASNQSNFALEIGSSVPTYETPLQASEANVGSSSSARLPGAGNFSNSINENVTVAPDSLGQKGCDSALTKRLVNMLGSISAPPAFAAESPTSTRKSFGQVSATSSIHVTAGMIQIHGFEMVGMAEHWSLHKNGDAGFLLSYGVASDVVSKSTISKTQALSMSVVLRGGFYLFSLSALFLALCFKVGMCVYSR